MPSTLSERDVCSKFITPAITAAGWDLHSQIREEVTRELSTKYATAATEAALEAA